MIYLIVLILLHVSLTIYGFLIKDYYLVVINILMVLLGYLISKFGGNNESH